MKWILGLFRLVAWLAFTLASSFLILILLDYGVARFPHGFQSESKRVIAFGKRFL